MESTSKMEIAPTENEHKENDDNENGQQQKDVMENPPKGITTAPQGISY